MCLCMQLQSSTFPPHASPVHGGTSSHFLATHWHHFSLRNARNTLLDTLLNNSLSLVEIYWKWHNFVGPASYLIIVVNSCRSDRYCGGAAPIRDGHVCSGAVSGRGWSGRHRSRAWQSGAGCGAVFCAATSKRTLLFQMPTGKIKVPTTQHSHNKQHQVRSIRR